MPQCRVPNTELRPLMSSMMSISPMLGHGRAGAQRRAEHPERRPVAGAVGGVDVGLLDATASIRSMPPAGAPKSARWVSIRPEVQPPRGSVPECSAWMTRWPAPSW